MSESEHLLEVRRWLRADLSEWAVEARYPGDWPEATEADARAAVQRAGSLDVSNR